MNPVPDRHPGGPAHPVVVRPEDSLFLRLPPHVSLTEGLAGRTGVTAPDGFMAAGVAGGLKESGRLDAGVLAVVRAHWNEAVSAALFTRNSFAAAPVLVCRHECDLPRLVAVALNAGNANACTGPPGLKAARAVQACCAQSLGAPTRRVAVGSTGVIGAPLDGTSVVQAVRRAASSLAPEGGADFALSIQTTDRFVKESAVRLSIGGETVHIGACAKGAGMIAPSLATMLCVATTDAVLSSDEASALLRAATGASFNTISVDGQTSTNDSLFFLASGAAGVRPTPAELERLGEALTFVLHRLALMMVADGEGATKILKLCVTGAADAEDARRAASAVADSTLVKTAMYGCDPNWGRVLSAVGAALPDRSFPDVSLRFAGTLVVHQGTAAPLSHAERAALTHAMLGPEVEIILDLAAGAGSAEIYFSDLGHEYVTINAEYHT